MIITTKYFRQGLGNHKEKNYDRYTKDKKKRTTANYFQKFK